MWWRKTLHENTMYSVLVFHKACGCISLCMLLSISRASDRCALDPCHFGVLLSFGKRIDWSIATSCSSLILSVRARCLSQQTLFLALRKREENNLAFVASSLPNSGFINRMSLSDTLPSLTKGIEPFFSPSKRRRRPILLRHGVSLHFVFVCVMFVIECFYRYR